MKKSGGEYTNENEDGPIFHETALFEEFLSLAQVELNPTDSCVLFASGPTLPGRGKLPDLYLTYPALDLTLDSVISKLCKGMQRVGQASDRDIAITVLGLLAETRNPEKTAVEHANHCLSRQRRAQLHQIVVLPEPCREARDIPIGCIRFTSFDPEKLLYQAKRAGSQYPRDLNDLKGYLSINRDRFDVDIIDWHGGSPEVQRLIEKWGAEYAEWLLLDSYYQSVNSHYLAEIPHILRRELLVLEGSGMVVIPPEELLTSFLNKTIGLLRWDGGGWAMYLDQVGLSLNTPLPHQFSEYRKWLTDSLGFAEFSDDKQLDKSIRSYCRFLQRAQHHRTSGRRDEAFLHFVIALDQLLGTTRDRLIDRITGRAAILVHRQREVTLEHQIDEIKKLYNKRSGYVHEGTSPSKVDLDNVEAICSQILWTLLAASAKGEICDVDAWCMKIDLLSAKLAAGEELSDSDFADLGIPEVGVRRVQPNRVTDGDEPVNPFVPRETWRGRRWTKLDLQEFLSS